MGYQENEQKSEEKETEIEKVEEIWYIGRVQITMDNVEVVQILHSRHYILKKSINCLEPVIDKNVNHTDS